MNNKKIKILLLQPPMHELSICFGILEPYALEVLSTAIQNDGELRKIVEVKILDLRIDPLKILINLLQSENINIVGITGITIDQPKIIEIATLIKILSPKSLVVVGGHHATMLPKDYFIPDIDLIVRGPGHKVIIEIIKRKITNDDDYSGIKGIIYNTGQLKFTECHGWSDNINEAPPISINKTINKRYRWISGHHINVVVTAQGCSGRCSFCACWPAMGGKYISKTPIEVFKEIVSTKEKGIFFGDDNTFQDVNRMKEVAKLIKKSNIKKRFYGYCRTDTIVKHPELFETWKKIGLMYLTVGFEDISDKGLESLNKNSSTTINENANTILQKLGIINGAHLLINPNFTYDDFENLKNYIQKLGIVEPVFPILTPLPGTSLWKKYKKQVELTPRQFFDFAHPIIKTELNINEFYKLLFEQVKATYSKKRWLISKSKSFMNKLSGANKYPLEQTISANLFSVLFANFIVQKKYSKEKILSFQKGMDRVKI